MDSAAYHDHILACIKWFEPLPDNQHNWLGETIDLWSHSDGQHSYISVHQNSMQGCNCCNIT